MKRHDKFNLLSDPFEAKEKSDKDKAQNRATNKKRQKGTGRITRADQKRPEDL